MKFQIINRWTNKVIIEAEAETLKEVVVSNKSALQGADLRASSTDASWKRHYDTFNVSFYS